MGTPRKEIVWHLAEEQFYSLGSDTYGALGTWGRPLRHLASCFYLFMGFRLLDFVLVQPHCELVSATFLSSFHCFLQARDLL